MARILLIVLTFALLIGLSPISNQMTMQTMQMDEMTMSQYGDMAGENSAGKTATMPCCDETAQFFISCTFVVPKFASVGLAAKSERIGNSTPFIQSIYIKALSPPPKI